MIRYVGRFAVAVAMAAAGYFLIYRPLQLRWGATPQELTQVMPGDEIQPHPILNATRCVTIRVSPEQIWPWLVQIGYRRAGWYGYDWIDNDGIPSADRILAKWQELKVGDVVPIWKNLNFPVRELEANRYLVFASKSGNDSMALALFPTGPDQTRLIWRIRLGPYNWRSPWIFVQTFTDLADFIAVRQNLLGIKARAEGAKPESPAKLYSELGMWLVSFLCFVAAEIGVILWKELRGPVVTAAATGLITVFLVLAKPPAWVDTLGVLLGVLILWRAFCIEPKRS